MLAVEDYLDTLNWAKGIGGLKALRTRADGNAKVMADWVAKTPWIEHLPQDDKTRSNTSVCMKLADPDVTKLPAAEQLALIKSMEAILEKEGVAYDVANHRDAPPSLRVWCGCTVEQRDLEALTPWLDWAFAEAKGALAKAA
jgi:phosphoserine aminotransferase